MKYVKFTTLEEAEEYKGKLQAHHDATPVEGPKVIDCVFVTYDGKYACTLIDDDYPETTGEIVDSVEPPVVEE